MRASAIEFRLRMLIHAAIICLGFWAPWAGTWAPTVEFAPRISLLEWLSLHMSRLGLLGFADSTRVVILCSALIAALGALLRIWGSAYLGPATVQNLEMKAGSVMADGPFRYVRNPLYLGLWFMAIALAFLMPPSGALLAIVLVTLFDLRLIFGEEAFLASRLGEPYFAYKRSVPRLIPRFRGAPASATSKPKWLRALLSELTPIGVFVSLGLFSWSYNNRLMIRVILIAFGVSLIARALIPGVFTGGSSQG